jgi:hypothetical protein
VSESGGYYNTARPYAAPVPLLPKFGRLARRPPAVRRCYSCGGAFWGLEKELPFLGVAQGHGGLSGEAVHAKAGGRVLRRGRRAVLRLVLLDLQWQWL